MKPAQPIYKLANTNHPRFNGVQLELRPGSFVIYDADQPAANGVELLFNQLGGLRAALDLVERRLQGGPIEDAHPPALPAMLDSFLPIYASDSTRTGLELYVVKARAPSPDGRRMVCNLAGLFGPVAHEAAPGHTEDGRLIGTHQEVVVVDDPEPDTFERGKLVEIESTR